MPVTPKSIRNLFLACYLALGLGLAHGASADTSGGIGIYGGSFAIPTRAHADTMARLIDRTGFGKLIMEVASPYKEGAAPAETSLHYSRVLVETFDETLQRLGIEYKDFKVEGPGHASWIGRDGLKHEIQVSDYEITHQIKGDTLATLKHYRQVYGDPRNIYFIAGADLNPSTWTPGKDDWQELFRQSHWLFVNRYDPKQPEGAGPDPLGKKLGAFAAGNFEHRFDPKTNTHDYVPKDPAQPGMTFMNVPSLEASTSAAKKALAAGDPLAGEILTPAILREVITRGDYKTVLNDENLRDYLHWMFHRLESKSGDPKAFRLMTDELVRRTLAAADVEKMTPGYRVFLAKAWEEILEKVRIDQLVPNMRKLYATLSKKLGPSAAAAFVAGEVFEQTLGPVIAYKLAGAAGLAVSPFLHQEAVTIPAVLAYKRLQTQRRRWRLADSSKYLGDRELYKEIVDLRSKLLRGDPEAIVSRSALSNGLGLGDPEMVVNLVQSRMPSWMPLPVRRWTDKKVTWYDLNLSTNELKAILADPVFADKLAANAEEMPGHFGQLLLAAILKNPEAKNRLELFTAHRYFKRLSLGEIPPSLMSDLKQEEREFVARARAFSAELSDAFAAKSDREFFQEVVSDFYAVLKVVRQNPAAAEDPKFWTDFLDLMVTRYPGQKLNLNRASDRSKLAARLRPLSELMSRHGGPHLSGMTIQYGDRPLVILGGPGEAPTYLDADVAKEIRARQGKVSERERIRLAALENAYEKYVERNPQAFASSIAAPHERGTGEATMLSRARNAQESINNLELEMDGWISKHAVERRWFLAYGYEQRDKYLKSVQTGTSHKDMARVFGDAWKRAQKELNQYDAEFSQLEADWLKLRKSFQLEETESKIPGYEAFRARYEALRAKYETTLERMHAIVRMTNGSQAVDMSGVAQLRAGVAAELGYDGERLGDPDDFLRAVLRFCRPKK